MKEDVVLTLVQMQNQFRFLHWQTMSESKHRAYGDVYSALGTLIDTFTEACMGKHGRIELDANFTLEFKDITAINIQEYLDEITDFLVSITEMYDEKYDTDLLNIRDEMLFNINKLKYLLTFKP
jgi:hypothetical protein